MHYLGQSRFSFDVYVVDNGSKDGSPDYIKSNFPNIILIQNDENLGFAKANNIALRLCDSRYVLLVNNDVEFISNVFDEIIDFMDRSPDVAVSGCQLIDGKNSLQRSHGSFHTFNNERYALMVDILYPVLKYKHELLRFDDISCSHDVDYVSGAFFFIRRSVLDEIGMLDEDYFFYTEEADFCYRVKQQTRYRTVFIPYLKVIHFGGGSSLSLNRYKYEYQLLSSKLHFAEKFYTRKELILFRLLSVASLTMRMLRCLLKRMIHNEPFDQEQRGFYKKSILLYLK